MKQIRRIISVPCPDCWGSGLPVGSKCSTCKGTGNVERIIVEIVHDENAPATRERGQ